MPSSSARPSATIAARRSERARARPGEILAAARELFSRKGFDATRMDEVAAAVGMTKPAVYRYFPGKDQLIEALLEEDLAGPGRAVVAWIDAHPGPVADLVTGFSERVSLMDMGGLGRAYMMLAMDETGRRPRIAAFIREQVLEPGLAALARAFERAMSRGELAAGHDPASVARLFFAPFLQTTLGTVGYALPVGDAEERDRYRAFHTAAFLRAFAP